MGTIYLIINFHFLYNQCIVPCLSVTMCVSSHACFCLCAVRVYLCMGLSFHKILLAVAINDYWEKTLTLYIELAANHFRFCGQLKSKQNGDAWYCVWCKSNTAFGLTVVFVLALAAQAWATTWSDFICFWNLVNHYSWRRRLFKRILLP